MSMIHCTCNKDCTLWAVIAGIVIGILVAFLRITAVIAPTAPVFIGALAVAIVYLAVTLIASVFAQRMDCSECLCNSVNAVLGGILGTVLTAVILLVVPFAATSIPGAIILGLLAASATLMLVATACLIRCLFRCSN